MCISVLTCTAGYHNIVVIAHTDDADHAREAADELYARHEAIHGIYLILVTDEQTTAIADSGLILNLTVQVAANKLRACRHRDSPLHRPPAQLPK